MLLGVVALTAAAYLAARHWQAPETYRRLAPEPSCDLRAGPCTRAIPGGALSLAISPASIPLMKTLTLQVDVEGPSVESVVVEIRGLNMDMGLNRTRLAPLQGGGWGGETILPLCSQRRMEWEAAVRVRLPEPVEIPFLFDTQRR